MSSYVSPSPTNFTGSLTSFLIATTMPPFAVPSSLARKMPVTSIASRNALAWLMAFCPQVASSTSSTSCGAPGIFLATTSRILVSSRIRLSCVCSRPAVSTSSTSAPRAFAASQASKTTAAGSEPDPLMMSQPMRSAQMVSCWTAAARNVSAAASMTFLPDCWNSQASFATDVVLPLPLMPATRTTVGGSAAKWTVRSDCGQYCLISALRNSMTSSPFSMRFSFQAASRSSWIRVAVATPTSAWISVASSSFSRSGLSLRPRSIAWSEPTNLFLVRLSPVASFFNVLPNNAIYNFLRTNLKPS